MMRQSTRSSMTSLDLIKRIAVYSLLTLILGCSQCAFFPMLNFVGATPDLILCMLVAIALIDGNASAMVCAVAAGFFVDAIGASGPALSPFIYFMTVALLSLFTAKILKSLPSFLLLLIPALLCRAFGTYLSALAYDRAFPPAWIFTDVIFPEAISTALCAIPIYFIVRLCAKIFKKRSRFTF